MKKVAFYTLGCKVNQYDTEAMMEKFRQEGYELVDFDEKADIYVVNSCAVTGQAAKKSRQMVRRAKSQNPDAIVGIAGCYSQMESDKILKMEQVDFVIGNRNRNRIVEIAREAARKKEVINTVEDLWQGEKPCFEEIPISRLIGRTRASIKVQEGCNQFCSYCIIPYARGPVRSRKPDDVFSELNRLCATKVREFVLTGIHLGAYGQDFREDYDLVSLIKDILHKVPELERLRLSSIEITEVSSKLIDVFASEQKLCRHLHIPLQSGSDRILRKMNRPYDAKFFREKVKEIRSKVPEISLTTDIMVGFPGEEEKDFKDTYDLVRDLSFSRLHVFRYSPRPGTRAYKMKPRIDSAVKQKRSKKLRELGEVLQKNYSSMFLGKNLEVLVEEERKEGYLTGLTDNYLRVIFKGDDHLKGELVDVKLLKIIDEEKVLAEPL